MYIIKNIGRLTKEKQIEIIKSFKERDEEIFFPYCVPQFEGLSQNEKEILVEQSMEFYSEDYFNKWIFMYEGVQDAIYKKIEKIVRNYLKDKKENDFDSLMNNISCGNLEGFDKKTIYAIKYAITYEIIENNYDKRRFEQMKKRKIFKNHYMFDQTGRYDSEGQVWWYNIEDESNENVWNRIFSSAESDMIVADINKSFDDYSYALVYVESAEDYDLLIYTNKDREFEQRIKPKIEKINSDIVKYIEKIK